jgi:hypothetical protein
MHDPSDSEPLPSVARIVADAAPELLGAGVGGALQLAGSDPASSTLAASAVLVALRLDRANWEHAVGRAARTITLAAEQVGSEELLEQRATTNAHRRELTARVLRAAARTPLEDKLPALATVLASGIDPDGRVDEALVLVDALDDLEAPHVQVLQFLTQDAPDEDPARRGFGWLIEQAVDALPGYALVMPAILSTLARHGLGRELGMYGGVNRLAITDLGRRCLDLLSPQSTID